MCVYVMELKVSNKKKTSNYKMLLEIKPLNDVVCHEVDFQ